MKNESVDSERSHSESVISQQRVYADVNRVLTFAAVLLLGFHVSWTVFPSDTVGLALQLLFFALLVLALNRWTAAMLLALAEVPLFLASSWDWDTVPSIDEMLIAFQLLTIVALICRLHSPVGSQFSVLKTMKLLLGSGQQRDQQRQQTLSTAADAARDFLLSTLSLIAVMVAVTLLAAFLLQVVPMESGFRAITPRVYGLQPTAFRLITLGGLLFIGVLVTWIVVAEVNFRRLSIREASMYLRSQLIGWLHRDFRMVVRKHGRGKRNRKRS